MQYFDTYEQASIFAHQAVDLMIHHRVPPNPRNFAVWFAYCTKQHAELTDAIDDLLIEKPALDPNDIEHVNEVYYSRDSASEAIRETSHKIQTAVGRVLEFVAQSGDETARYGQVLEDFSGRIADDASLDEIRGLVSGILSDTRNMEEHSRRVQNQIETSTSEINELRRDLESIRQESLTDGLTGVANRRSFDMTLSALAEEAGEEETPLALLMCDIDHFKVFNDTYGHPLGDQVLRLVAKTLVECIKGRDVAARYGGEEFAVILPQTRLKDAVTLARHIRTALATKKVVSRTTGRELGTVTISIGAAAYRPGEALSALVDRADTALYAAKQAGRNRVMAEAADTRSVA